MERNENLGKDAQDPPKYQLMDESDTIVNPQGSMQMKKFIYLASLAGMGLLQNSCATGYAGTAYAEFARSVRPGNLIAWRDGDWGWNSHSHMYVNRTGSWDKQREGLTFGSVH